MNQASVSVDAILFQSPDPLKLCQFYQKAFDLSEPKWHGDAHVGSRSGNVYIGFDRSNDASKPSTRITVWFKVKNVEQAFENLKALGATARKNPDKECSPGETLAEMLDPEGNVVGLIGP